MISLDPQNRVNQQKKMTPFDTQNDIFDPQNEVIDKMTSLDLKMKYLDAQNENFRAAK